MNVIYNSFYQCGQCGRVYDIEAMAEKCCKDKRCEDCGCALPSDYYFLVCDECKEKRVYERSEKLTIDEYNKKYKGNMVFYKDNYYPDINDCLESLSWNLSKEEFFNISYIYGTLPYSVKLDYENIIEDMEENSNLEDFYVDDEGRKELKDFLKQWNKKWGTIAYMVDNIVIKIPQNILQKYWSYNNEK